MLPFVLLKSDFFLWRVCVCVRVYRHRNVPFPSFALGDEDMMEFFVG